MAARGPGQNQLAQGCVPVARKGHPSQARVATRGRLVQELRAPANGDGHCAAERRVRGAGSQGGTGSQDAPARHLEVDEREGQSAETVLVGEDVRGAGGETGRARVPKKDCR